jgi:hypothetical protein
LCGRVGQRTSSLTALRKALLTFAEMSRGDKSHLLNQQRLLKEATDLFGRKVIAEGLKISEATLDGWMSGRSEMPDTMLIALAHLLVKFAGKDRK